MPIRLNDNIQPFNFGQMNLINLKGSVRVVLKDKKTGKIEREIRGSNIITNAVKDIFSRNELGCISNSSLMPIYQNWYGGILGYKEAHADETDPTDYFIKGNDVQELVGFAGDVNPSTSQLAEDRRRGRKIAETLGEHSYEQTFEWGSEEGNGVWSAVSLCHKDLGNAGTGSESSAFQAFSPFANIGNLPNAVVSLNSPDNIFVKYDSYHSLWFHIGGENDTYARGSTSFTSTWLTIIIRRLPYDNVGLRDTLVADSSYSRTFYIELGFNIYNQPSYFFDYDNKKLWIFSNLTSATDGYNTQTFSPNTVHYAIIDCETETVDSEGTIVSDDDDLAPTSMEMYPNRSIAYNPSINRNANIIKDGNYVYLPMSDNVVWGNYQSQGDAKFNVKALKKINISNQSDQTVIPYNDVQLEFKSAFKLGGLIINSGRVVNGGVAYTCTDQFGDNQSLPTYHVHSPYNISSVVTQIGAGSYNSSTARYIMANKMVNTTIFNLKNSQLQPTAITKDNTKLLQITYTLTEVT